VQNVTSIVFFIEGFMSYPDLATQKQTLKTEIIIGERNAKKLSDKIRRQHTSPAHRSTLTQQLREQQEDLRQMHQELRQLESES